MLVSLIVDPKTLHAVGLEWASDFICSEVAQALEVPTRSEVEGILELAEMRKGLGKSPAAWLPESWVFKALAVREITHAVSRPPMLQQKQASSVQD